MGTPSYYMLMASLPALQRFESVERLPITRERLTKRLAMLTPEDAALVDRATDLLSWFRQTPTRSDDAVHESHERLASSAKARGLTELFEIPIALRIVTAAFRRRRRRPGAPAPGERWGVGPLVPHMERHWRDPLFGLGMRYPWIVGVRDAIEDGDALALQQILSEILWARYDGPSPGGPFGIEAVFAYLFKWNVLQQWLARDTEGAKQRFSALVAAITDEWEELFNDI